MSSDSDPACEWLARTKLHLNLTNERLWMSDKKIPGDQIGNLLLDFQNAKETFEEVEVGQCYFIVDEFASRVHTPVTNLPKSFRRYLRGPSDTRLVELDIACSQPLFAAIAASQDGFNSFKYTEACEQGTLYDLIQTTHRMRKRHTAKGAILHYLFRDPTDRVGRIDGFMRNEFPQFHEWVKQVKGTDTTGGVQLAKRMQAAEVDLVINGLCKRIFTERPETFVLTIHDALLVEPQDASWVKEWFDAEFDSLGVRPTIRQRFAGD